MPLLTTSAVAAVIAKVLSTKPAEKFMESAGQAMWDGAAAGLGKLRDWLLLRPTVAPAVRKLDADPQDPAARAELEKSLESEMARDKSFEKDLTQIAQHIEHNGGTINNQTFFGDVGNIFNVTHNTGGLNIDMRGGGSGGGGGGGGGEGAQPR
jgi:hypothetical protein